MSEIIYKTREIFKSFDSDGSGKLVLKELKDGFVKLGVDIAEEDILSLFNEFDIDGSGEIDSIEWLGYLKVEDLRFKALFTSGENCILPSLNSEELQMLVNMMRRMNEIAEYAAINKVKLMVDAEHTYFQPAIDHATLNLMRRYNKKEHCVFNTYQAYLTDSLERLTIDMEKAEREGWFFAVKLVRGAYMNLERNRAKEIKYKDPIWSTLDETHKNYHACMDKILSSDTSKVLLGSHNQQSVEYAVSQMSEKGIDKEDKRVYFGQLLGMADNLSLTLGQNGFSVYKYVPYGPIQEVMPYLIRRAEENSNILGATAKERGMIAQELRRRLFWW